MPLVISGVFSHDHTQKHLLRLPASQRVRGGTMVGSEDNVSQRRLDRERVGRA